MNLNAALLAMATAGAFLLVAACGGDGGDNGQSQPVSATGTSALCVAIDLHASGYVQTNGYFYTVASGIGEGEQVGEACCTSTGQHALLWRDTASSVVDLHPGGVWIRSIATATSGGIQVGVGSDGNVFHALKWAGSASSAVDLHPSQFRVSSALGISGDQIVGVGSDPGIHALLWTSRGLVDLHPAGFVASRAYGTDGAQQVGSGTSTTDNNEHALLWKGSGNSVVDLHPAGYTYSLAAGVSGGQQVGYGVTSSGEHALLWTGSAESVVDLHPSGFNESYVAAVAAGRQVGAGRTADYSPRALLWNGTADSVVNLHMFLPAGFDSSEAYGIDASGNVIGTAWASGYGSHAILWVRNEAPDNATSEKTGR